MFSIPRAGFLVIVSLLVLAAPALKSTAEETDVFLKEYAMAGEPEAVTKLFITAMIQYPENKEECLRRFTILLSDGQLDSGDAYEGQMPGKSFRFLLGQLEQKPYVARSYIQGTSPENGYAPPEGGPWEIILTPDPLGQTEENTVKLFVDCTGADSARPITLVKNSDGLWKVLEGSSLFTGVRPPVQ